MNNNLDLNYLIIGGCIIFKSVCDKNLDNLHNNIEELSIIVILIIF